MGYDGAVSAIKHGAVFATVGIVLSKLIITLLLPFIAYGVIKTASVAARKTIMTTLSICKNATSTIVDLQIKTCKTTVQMVSKITKTSLEMTQLLLKQVINTMRRIGGFGRQFCSMCMDSVIKFKDFTISFVKRGLTVVKNGVKATITTVQKLAELVLKLLTEAPKQLFDLMKVIFGKVFPGMVKIMIQFPQEYYKFMSKFLPAYLNFVVRVCQGTVGFSMATTSLVVLFQLIGAGVQFVGRFFKIGKTFIGDFVGGINGILELIPAFGTSLDLSTFPSFGKLLNVPGFSGFGKLLDLGALSLVLDLDFFPSFGKLLNVPEFPQFANVLDLSIFAKLLDFENFGSLLDLSAFSNILDLKVFPTFDTLLELPGFPQFGNLLNIPSFPDFKALLTEKAASAFQNSPGFQISAAMDNLLDSDAIANIPDKLVWFILDMGYQTGLNILLNASTTSLPEIKAKQEEIAGLGSVLTDYKYELARLEIRADGSQDPSLQSGISVLQDLIQDLEVFIAQQKVELDQLRTNRKYTFDELICRLLFWKNSAGKIFTVPPPPIPMIQILGNFLFNTELTPSYSQDIGFSDSWGFDEFASLDFSIEASFTIRAITLGDFFPNAYDAINSFTNWLTQKLRSDDAYEVVNGKRRSKLNGLTRNPAGAVKFSMRIIIAWFKVMFEAIGLRLENVISVRFSTSFSVDTFIPDELEDLISIADPSESEVFDYFLGMTDVAQWAFNTAVSFILDRFGSFLSFFVGLMLDHLADVVFAGLNAAYPTDDFNWL